MGIQDLIDAAPPCGTVNVAPRIYSELLVINKPLNLEGPDLSAGEAIVDAADLAAAPTLLITSDQVTVRLITFHNGPGQGIRVVTASEPNLQELFIGDCVIRRHDYAGIININGDGAYAKGSAAGLLVENNR